MKVLVTGSTGFIGSAVVRKLLDRGREVRCYVEPGANTRNIDGLDVERVEGDVNDRERIGEALEGCDTLYHLAALYKVWLRDTSLIYRVNVEGTKTVLWAAYKADLDKVVFTSSIGAIGVHADGRPADEETEFNLWDDSNAYVRSKWLSQQDALRFVREGLPLVVVSPTFTFGERDSAPTPTGMVLLFIMKGMLPGYIDGGFNAVDVDDVAEGHLLAEEKGRVGECYILGSHNVSYREFSKIAAEIAGTRAPDIKLPSWVPTNIGRLVEAWSDHVTHKTPLTTYKAMLYSTRQLYYDTTKARTELGLPSTPLRTTVEKAIGWYRDNGYLDRGRKKRG